MAFRREKTYKMTWEVEDDELNGLEVRAGTVPIGDYLMLEEFCLHGTVPSEFAEEPDPDKAAFEWSVEKFGSALKSWNLEDDEGKPVPANIDGFRVQDREFILRLIVTWVRALATVSAPLSKPSPAGERSAEDSIPMEIPS